MTTKKRYIPDPQVEPIALTEEQLRQLVREEVAKALAPLSTTRPALAGTGPICHSLLRVCLKKVV